MVYFLFIREAFTKDFECALTDNDFSIRPEMQDLFIFGGTEGLSARAGFSVCKLERASAFSENFRTTLIRRAIHSASEHST